MPADLSTLNAHLTRLGLHLHARELVGEPQYAVLAIDHGIAQLVVDVAAACVTLACIQGGESYADIVWRLSQAVVPGVRVIWAEGQYRRGEAHA